MYQVFKKLTDFNEIWYKHYATKGNPNSALFKFLHIIIGILIKFKRRKTHVKEYLKLHEVIKLGKYETYVNLFTESKIT